MHALVLLLVSTIGGEAASNVSSKQLVDELGRNTFLTQENYFQRSHIEIVGECMIVGEHYEESAARERVRLVKGEETTHCRLNITHILMGDSMDKCASAGGELEDVCIASWQPICDYYSSDEMCALDHLTRVLPMSGNRYMQIAMAEYIQRGSSCKTFATMTSIFIWGPQNME